MTRLPFAPLDQHARIHRDMAPRGTQHDGTAWSDRNLADLLGVTRRAVVRWRHAGIPIYSADRAAVALGVHPSLIWPEWWEGASDVA